jgi:hypothetical protein
MRELATENLPDLGSAAEDVVPRVMVRVDLPHYVWRWVKVSEGWPLTTIGLGVMLVSVASLVVLTRRRKATTGTTSAHEAIGARATGGVRSL